MERETRTQKAVKNVSITMLCQIIYILVSFICRTVFTKVLGAEYLGLNGLFTNILTMLSFVELGIGSALVYKMYKPLASNDQYMLCVYMNFYKRVYRVIALIVALLGLCITPFLTYLVKEPNIDINIHVLYLLFLADTVITYLYVYKKSILIADQKNYVVSIYTQIFNVIMNIGQILILLVTHDFIVYLIFKILCDWLNNVFCAKRAEKDYPFINNKVEGDISPEDKAELKKNIKGLVLGKIASVAFDGTDNVFISMFVGVASVGVISNYTLILTTLNTLFNQIFNSLTSSIGQLGVNSSKKTLEEIFKKLYFANTLLYGYLFVGMTLLLRMFVVNIWVGARYSLPVATVTLIILELVLRGIHYPVYMTRTAMGLFYQMKYVPLICALLNIGLDFILGIKFGIIGITLATIIARLITRLADIYVLYKYTFQKSIVEYYINHAKYLLFISCCTVLSYFAIQLTVSLRLLVQFVLDVGIISAVFWGCAIILFRKSNEFQYYYNLILNKLLKRNKNDKN